MTTPKNKYFTLLIGILFLLYGCNKGNFDKEAKMKFSMEFDGQNKSDETLLDASNYEARLLNGVVQDIALIFTLFENPDTTGEYFQMDISIDVEYGNSTLKESPITAKRIAQIINSNDLWEGPNLSDIQLSMTNSTTNFGIVHSFEKGVDGFNIEASYNGDWLKIDGYIKEATTISSFSANEYSIADFDFSFTVKIN